MTELHQQRRVLALALTTALLPSLRAQSPDALDSVRRGNAVLRKDADNDPSAVKALQERLQAFLSSTGNLELSTRMRADGKFGAITQQAVEQFQVHVIATPPLQEAYTKAAGKLLIHPDKAVGKGTVAALDAYAPHSQFLRQLDEETRRQLCAKLGTTMPDLSPDQAILAFSKSIGLDWTERQTARLQSLCGQDVTGVLTNETCHSISHILSAAWYGKMVTEGNAQYQWNSGPDAVNVVGLRGFDIDRGRHRNPFNQWNDTIAIIRYNEKGVPTVFETRGTTDPGQKEAGGSPDVNRDGKGDVAHLVPGQYEFKVGTHKGKGGALVPKEDLPVYRDTNNNGVIDSKEGNTILTGSGIHIHWTSRKNPAHVGGESLGCQVPMLETELFKELFTQGVRGPVRYTLLDLSIK